MSTHFENVKEFMTIFGQEVLTTPTLPTSKIGLLRYDLIEEEADELAEAMVQDDIVEIADALADILYVVYGAYAAMGLTPNTILTDTGPWIDLRPLRLPNITEAIEMNCALQDELKSMMNSYKSGNLDGIGRALDGILSCVYQFSEECGIDIYECFGEVHGSNLSKTCLTQEEAEESIDVRLNEEGKEDYRGAKIVKVGIYYVIKRSADSKVLKGIMYYEPNLADILGL